MKEVKLKANTSSGSGRVRRFTLPDGKTRITQITTFCPDMIGPGPTHVYVIEGEALVMLDAGIPTYLAKLFFYHWRNQPLPPEVGSLAADHSEQELLDGFKLAGYSPADIDLLVISHGHLDHFMLAPAILARCNARVAAHVIDTPGLCNPWALLHMFISRQDQMLATGMPPAYKSRERIREAVEGGFGWDPNAFAVKVDAPLLEEGPLRVNGSAIPGLEVLHIPGHTPGSVGLLVGPEGGKVLMCGDVLLFPITPHPDELFVYLQTLQRLKSLEGVGLVLPAHGKAIHDLRARVEFLHLHHKKRLKATYEACREPRCVWDIAAMPKYFDTYVDPGKFNFLAGSEALVHMEMLAMVNGLSRSHIADSVHYFQNSGEPFDEVYNRIVERMESGSVAPLMRY